MGVLIGMDEAGYGPNLGPLVVTATVWDVPHDPSECDPWSAFADALTSRADGDRRLHVSDSKQVYTPARGIGALESGVLAALSLRDQRPARFSDLCRALLPRAAESPDVEPWFHDRDVELPLAARPGDAERFADVWRTCCDRTGIRLRTIRSDVVLTRRFNALTAECGSKGVALSRISLQLLRDVWNPDSDERTRIVADKHGGRNRYEDLLAEIADGAMILCRGAGRECSVYRVGAAEIRFQTKAEAHLPVALASMVSKYVREVAMELFNGFWCERLPGLKPTKGYPVDAKRFRKDVADLQRQLAIPDEIFWRAR